MDANFSLKRMATPASRSVGDDRKFEDSQFYISPSFVNQFAHEVNRPKVSISTTIGLNDLSNVDDDSPEEHHDDDAADPTDGGPASVSSCTDNWKAAASEEKKRMWGIFEETGIFACACRHGQVMWLADMIRSGELSVALHLRLCDVCDLYFFP